MERMEVVYVSGSHGFMFDDLNRQSLDTKIIMIGVESLRNSPLFHCLFALSRYKEHAMIPT